MCVSVSVCRTLSRTLSRALSLAQRVLSKLESARVCGCARVCLCVELTLSHKLSPTLSLSLAHAHTHAHCLTHTLARSLGQRALSKLETVKVDAAMIIKLLWGSAYSFQCGLLSAGCRVQHTDTHTLSFTHPLSHTLSLPHTHSHTLSLSHSLSLTRALSRAEGALEAGDRQGGHGHDHQTPRRQGPPFFFFLFVTLKPRIAWYKSPWALNTSPFHAGKTLSNPWVFGNHVWEYIYI